MSFEALKSLERHNNEKEMFEQMLDDRHFGDYDYHYSQQKRLLESENEEERLKGKDYFKKIITPLDFLGIPKELDEQSLHRLISKIFQVDEGLIKKQDKSFFTKINKAYQIGKEFLKKDLGCSDLELDTVPNSLDTKKKLYSLFKKAELPRGKDAKDIKKRITAIKAYELIKEVRIAYETLNSDFDTLAENNENFKERMWNSESSPFVLEKEDTENDKYNVHLFFNKEFRAFIGNRKKDRKSAMLRMHNRPESNSRKALEDGIGFRIQAEASNALEIIPVLCGWLVRNRNVKRLLLENKERYFSEKQMIEFKEKILPYVSENNLEIEDNVKSNPTSAGIFRSFIIKGILNERMNEKEAGSSSDVRQFEIQFVLPDSSNEEGFSNRSIYTLNKILFARTRSRGYVSEKDFNFLVGEASRESGIDASEIIKYLTKKDSNGRSKIQTKKLGKDTVYVATETLERWENLDLVFDFYSK